MQRRTNTVVGRYLFLLALSVELLAFPTIAGSVADYGLQVSATVLSDPPQITLSWLPTASATGYSISRKGKDDLAWGQAQSLPSTTAAYVDTDVVVGGSYEYRISRTSSDFTSHSYIFAGIEAPLVESRGKLLLIVDKTVASPLATELDRLQQDLVGDGWTVLRHDVPRMAVDPANPDPAVWGARSNEVVQVKNLIKADCLADQVNVKAVFLFGHVPVPYSGALAPDRHPDHRGAWPADVYYGDLEGAWTDSSTKITTPDDPRNKNLIGDGKFDQTEIPGRVALQMGRVDLANLPAFPQSEVELLRRYLEKDHNFRHKILTAQFRALVNDNFGVLLGEVPAADAWGNFASLVGAANTSAGRWLTELVNEDYLWGYGCGDGTYTRAAGVLDTSHFLVYDPKVVFTALFGSYFGDWDTPNNLLRAQLAGSSYTLTATWIGRPDWYFHHMALGETIGFSTRLVQNNNGLYEDSYKVNGILIGGGSSLRQVHVALHGDPTLRLQPVAPPQFAVALTNDSGVAVIWGPSADPVLGYNIYRAASRGGPYSRLNETRISGNAFTDTSPAAGGFYMVRAVKLESSSSGTYFNASQGLFAEAPKKPTDAGSNTWPAQSGGKWNITDASGQPGSNPGWDRLEIDGALNVTATADNPFTVTIQSSTVDLTPGSPDHFDPNQSYSWPIVTASMGITGFEPGKINLLTSDFAGDLAGGRFRLALSPDGRSIHLVYTPNHAPETSPALFYRAWDTSVRIEIAELLAGFTSDSDGDARALLQIGTSTNGTSITTDSSSIVLDFSNNLPETLTYWVQDVREYRPGDTVRTAPGVIQVTPTPAALDFNAYHAIEIEWQGDMGKSYQIQCRSEAGGDWINEGPPIQGSGEKKSLFERTTKVTKFYRIIEVK